MDSGRHRGIYCPLNASHTGRGRNPRPTREFGLRAKCKELSMNHRLHRWSWMQTLVLVFFSSVLMAAQTPQDIEINDEPAVRDIEYPEWFSETFLDLREDLEEAKAAGKTGIIVYFGQKDCAYCEALIKVNFGREKDIVDYTRKNFNVIAINIWGSREVTDMDGETLTETEYSEKEKTHLTPTLLFYTEPDARPFVLRGYYPPYKFRAALEYVVDGYFKKETLRDYMARADPPGKFDVADMVEESFFESPPYALDRSHFPAEQPLVVFFEQHDCHACDILHSDPIRDPVVQRMLGNFDAVQLDMWSDTPVVLPDGNKSTAKEWAEKLGIFYAPTLVFFDEGGKEVMRVASVVKLYRLRGILEYVLKKGYLTSPTYQRWREEQQNSTPAE